MMCLGAAERRLLSCQMLISSPLRTEPHTLLRVSHQLQHTEQFSCPTAKEASAQSALSGWPASKPTATRMLQQWTSSQAVARNTPVMRLEICNRMGGAHVAGAHGVEPRWESVAR